MPPTKMQKTQTSGKRIREESQTFASRVKNVLMKNTETKRYTVAVENQQLYHNTGVTGGAFVGPLTFNLWRFIPQGTTENNRVGDEIVPRGMSVRLWLANKQDRPNILYRVIVCVLPRMYNASVVSAGSIDIGIQPNQGVNGSYLCLPVDTTKGIKVLYDKVFRNEVGNSNTGTGVMKECHFFKKIWIKSKKGSKIKYTRQTQEIENKFMAMYVIPYDSYGTLTTDNIASCAHVTTMYFKDP